jgi:hypothetical protein
MAGEKSLSVLKVLDAKLSEKIARDKKAKPQAAPGEEPREPGVLEILNDAIRLLPGTDAEFSILQRYPSGDFKDRMFKARCALETVHALLSEAD